MMKSQVVAQTAAKGRAFALRFYFDCTPRHLPMPLHQCTWDMPH